MSINVQFSQLQSFNFFGTIQQPQVQVDTGPLEAEVPTAGESPSTAGQQTDTLALSQPNQSLSDGNSLAAEADPSADSNAANTDKVNSNPDTTTGSTANAAAAFQGFDIQESRSLSLEIQTLDGDVVTIHFDQSSHNTSAAPGVSNASGGGLASRQSLEQGMQLDFSVEGNLSKEEHHAIKHLMERLGKLADKFFKGDMEGVMKRLGNLGFNEQQLAGFSFDLNQQQSVQAVSAYYGTESAVGSDDLAKAVDFTSAMKELPRPEFMKQPGESIGKLFSGVVEHKASHEGHEKPHQDVLERMKNLMDKTFKLADSMPA